MKLIGRLLPVIIALGVLASCTPADAGAYQYAGKRKKIYCGIAALVHKTMDGNNPGSTLANASAINTVIQKVTVNSRDYYKSLLTLLDSMNSLKPAGWTLENPLATTHDKYSADYWLVPVSSSRNLSRLNMLYLPGSTTLSLTDEERENLRRFVDNGGILWVDNVDSTSTFKFNSSGPFFINALQFSTGGMSNGPDAAVSRHHPLLCSPYWLTDVEIMNLGMNGAGGGWSRCYCDLGNVSALPSDQPAMFDVLFPIVDVVDSTSGALAGKPSVVANTYGSGRVVATANGVGRGCMMDQPYSLPSLKFAINIISYASSWTDLHKDPRHSGSSIDTLGANRLVEKWKLLDDNAQPAKPLPNKESAAMIYKNTVFYTAGKTIYALEQNGDTNGGIYHKDKNGAVIIWKWDNSGGGDFSAPTVATIQNPVGGNVKPIEAVLVQDSAGHVYVFTAFPLDFNGVPQPPFDPIYDFDTAPGGSGTDGKWPCPPIYVNGWIYAMGGDGRIYANNPCLKQWVSGGGGGGGGSDPAVEYQWHFPLLAAYNAAPKCGPSFGFMKNGNTGAVVGTVFWFTGKDNSITTPTDKNDHMRSLPVSVSMDRVRVRNKSTDLLKGEIWVSYTGILSSPDPSDPTTAIRIFRNDGVTPINVTGVDLNKNLSGQNAFGCLTVTAAEPIPTNALIFASYSISYNSTIGTSTQLDQQIEPLSPSDTGGTSHDPTLIPATPCLGPDNTIYITGSRAPSSGPTSTSGTLTGGSILAYRQDGSSGGQNTLKWHYLLHSGIGASDKTYVPGLDVQIPGVVMVTIKDPATGQQTQLPMVDPEPASSPVVSGGKVFVTVTGTVDGKPRGALLCLKASPEFVIRINESAGYDKDGSAIKRPKSLWKKTDQGHYEVKIWQPNLINSPSGAVPLLDARPAASGGITVDYDHGTITFNDFSLTKLTYMGTQPNTFSPSLPVWVWLDNVEVPIDWSTWYPGADVDHAKRATSDSVDLSGWNNLLWYYVVPDNLPCSGIHSSPVVIGNTVYIMTDEGTLISLDAETGESTCKQTTQTAIWTENVTKNASNSTVTLDPKASASVSGSNGVLIVPAADGLHGYTNSSTLVADNSRLVEIDGGGEITWAVDSIAWPATIPNGSATAMARKQGPVNKPSRARYANTGEILFANSGTNQVCKIDRSGTVGFEGVSGKYIRWIYDKFVDPKHMLRPGAPTQLRGPTDAILWQETESDGSNRSAAVSVVHCVIADSGNSRIVDLVYRVKNGKFVKYDGNPIDPSTTPEDAQYIDPDSGFLFPELNWVTKTDSQNERYAFDCLQLVTTQSGSKVDQDIWAASSNFTSNGTGSNAPQGKAGLGGAILDLGYRTRSTGSSGASWDYSAAGSGGIRGRCDHIELSGKVTPLANPRYFEVKDEPDGRHLLICDNYGVYEVMANGGTPTYVGALLAKDYRELPRTFEKDPKAADNDPAPTDLPLDIPLQATSVQMLANGRLLIANSYAGADSTGARVFNGEVFEFDRDTKQITWSSPRLQWNNAAGTWKQITNNTYNLRQPKSACRQQ